MSLGLQGLVVIRTVGIPDAAWQASGCGTQWVAGWGGRGGGWDRLGGNGQIWFLHPWQGLKPQCPAGPSKQQRVRRVDPTNRQPALPGVPLLARGAPSRTWTSTQPIPYPVRWGLLASIIEGLTPREGEEPAQVTQPARGIWTAQHRSLGGRSRASVLGDSGEGWRLRQTASTSPANWVARILPCQLLL